MTQARASSFGTTPEEDVKLDAAQSLHARLDKANLHILRHIAEFNSCRFDLDEAEDTENIEPRDPAIVAADVGAQLVCPEQAHDYLVPLILMQSLTVIFAETQVPISRAERQGQICQIHCERYRRCPHRHGGRQ